MAAVHGKFRTLDLPQPTYRMMGPPALRARPVAAPRRFEFPAYGRPGMQGPPNRGPGAGNGQRANPPRPPGDRLTPEERERLRNGIREGGRDVYGRPQKPNPRQQ
jgi:hypothetical protein